jgi:hypothetical protein
MIPTIIILLGALYWLLKETDWLRIRLLVGEPVKPKYARYKAYNALTKRKFYDGGALHEGNNYPGGYSPNGEPEYIVVLNPNITDILCGWEWLDKHCAAMVDYQPKVEMAIGGVRYSMTIKQTAIIKDVMRVNHLTRKQKLAYA